MPTSPNQPKRRISNDARVPHNGLHLALTHGEVQVPSGCRSLKVQTWGAGGGGGHFKGGQSGDGGGGAFAEALLYVTPDDELEVPLRRVCRCDVRWE